MSTLVTGLQFGGVCHRGAGEVLACGWSDSKILFRSSTAEDMSADVLHGTATELTVCTATVGEGSPIPRSAVVQHDDGSIIVTVDDGAGTIKTYRCRSFSEGFTEV